MDRPVPQVQLKERREQAIARLCEAFAQDRLELAELETRIDLAHRAKTAGDLEVLLEDLPAPAAAPPVPAAGPSAATRMTEAIRDSRTLLAFMGGVERRGNWAPGRKNVVIAIMGGADLVGAVVRAIIVGVGPVAEVAEERLPHMPVGVDEITTEPDYDAAVNALQ